MFESPKYTQVANSLVDDWLPKLSGAETKIILFLFRKIIGFHLVGNKAWLSVRQIQAGTGLSNREVIDSTHLLETKKLLVVNRVPGKTQCITIFFLPMKKLHRTGEETSPPTGEETSPPYILKKGYKETISKDNGIYTSVVNHLNSKIHRAFKPSESTKKLIRARIRDGYKLEDFIVVIDKKVSQWLGDEKMDKYLRPCTLFGTKFENYFNEPEQKPKSKYEKFFKKEE